MQTLTLQRSLAKDFLLVLLASFAICLSGQLSIPLWFTPIPLVTQNTVVLLIAALLGAKRGTAATFAFLAQGALGLPVFAGGVATAALLGPKAGYLIGYLVASFVVGTLVDKKKSLTTSLLIGNLVIYACGATYLATFVGPAKAFLLGIAPFILGDIVKTTIGIQLIQKVRKER